MDEDSSSDEDPLPSLSKEEDRDGCGHEKDDLVSYMDDHKSKHMSIKIEKLELAINPDLSYFGDGKRPLSQTELEQLAEHFREGFSSDEEPFPESGSEYVCSSSDESIDEIGGKKQKKQLGKRHQHNEIMDPAISERQQVGLSKAEDVC
nr:unnamed protein product [Callosobruchus analis]